MAVQRKKSRAGGWLSPAMSTAAMLAMAAGACPAAENAMKIQSSAFGDNQPIPKVYTCEGREVSPPLAWSEVPANAKSLVLIEDDPDAPDPAAPKITWVHWVLYNIPPSAHGLPEGVSAAALPKGTMEGYNGWNRAGYGGPCPPVGRHRYFHKLYALDVVLPDLKHPGKDVLEQAMKGHVIAQAQVVGTYQKGGK